VDLRIIQQQKPAAAAFADSDACAGGKGQTDTPLQVTFNELIRYPSNGRVYQSDFLYGVGQIV